MNHMELENLTAQVPEAIALDPVMAEIYAVQAAAVDEWLTAVWDGLDQVFPLTATHEGLKRLEHEANIQPKDFSDLPRRRSVLIGRIRGERTITKASIQDIVEAFGYGTVDVAVHANDFAIEITYADRLGLPAFLADVETELLRKLPAHLEVRFVIRYLVWDALDAMAHTWDALEAQALTWDQFEVWEG